MPSYLEQIPSSFHPHLRMITGTSGLPLTEDAVDLVARAWLEKKSRFESIIGRMSLEETGRLGKSDPRGCLAMTVSGSLVNIGPLRKNTRTVQYASIGFRKDVPETVTKIDSKLRADAVVGAPLLFADGPIASTSPLFKIALTAEEMDLEEQAYLFARATRSITREFIAANRELELGEG